MDGVNSENGKIFMATVSAQRASEKTPFEGSVHHPLADAFAAKFPDNEFTVVELQGYLLSYRTLPFVALDVTRERGERAAKQEREWKRKAKATGLKQEEAIAQITLNMPPALQGLFTLEPSHSLASKIVSALP